ncbi:MAG: MmgE/PrpD family protein [Pseudomonadota bacterium]
MIRLSNKPESGRQMVEHVIRFIRDTRWSQFPEAVRHQTRRCLLDSLGALLAGAVTPAGRLVTDIARMQFSGDEATILFYGHRVSASGAALANGFSGNALDVDDGYRMVKGHPGACVLPVVLAAAEMASTCSGKDFLTALAVGYEIGIRCGRKNFGPECRKPVSCPWLGRIPCAYRSNDERNRDPIHVQGQHRMGRSRFHDVGIDGP